MTGTLPRLATIALLAGVLLMAACDTGEPFDREMDIYDGYDWATFGCSAIPDVITFTVDSDVEFTDIKTARALVLQVFADNPIQQQEILEWIDGCSDNQR